jgi:flagellin
MQISMGGGERRSLSAINNINLAANVSQIYDDLFQSVSRLSSGLVLNSARDDAAAIVIRDQLRGEIAVAQQSSRNVNDAISMIQTADGAAGVMSDNLVRMKQLATQASSGIYSDQQISIMQNEFDQLAELNTHITETTTFNSIQLLEQDGSPIAISLGGGETISIARPGDISVGPVDLIEDPQAANAAVDSALNSLTAYRADIGATANRLESAASALDSKVENLLASESRISDVDIAKEVASLTANQIRLKAALAVQSHLNLMAGELNKLLS